MNLLFAIGTIVVVDRIEGPFAVLEWRDTHLTEVPVSALPAGVHEGDRLLVAARTLPPPRSTSSVARRPRRRPRGAVASRPGRSD
jgi:hypothetical protein